MWPFKRKQWSKIGTEFTYQRLRQLLINALAIEDIRLVDKNYRAIPKKDFIDLAWGGRENFNEWDKEACDCDDMALFYESDTRKQWAKKAKGSGAALAFGKANVIRKDGDNPHMMIWQVDDMGKINWFEPQTYEETKAPYQVIWIEG